MAFEHYIRSDGNNLRLGYTTGTCAALAAAGAVEGLLTGHFPRQLNLITPKGLEVCVCPVRCEVKYDEAPSGSECCSSPSKARCGIIKSSAPFEAQCGVIKDAGDDRDVTDGLVIMAKAQRWDVPAGVRILGGEGIGIVTKPGLDRKVGEAAINTVPREMIRREVLRVCEEQGYEGGITITISAPDGEMAALKTLNARMGIVGGISIIGTSGIVEPMSMKAYADSVRLMIRQAAEMSREDKAQKTEKEREADSGKFRASTKNPKKRLILTPGNYGLRFLREQGYLLPDVPVIVCSNFIGEALDEAAADGFEQILLAGHAGKLVKLAAGIMNTHSSVADARCEVFTAHAAMAGASQTTCSALMDAVTTDACIAILKEEGLEKPVLASILLKAQAYLEKRCPEAQCGLILFSNEYGELGRSQQADLLLEHWLKDNVSASIEMSHQWL